MTKRQLYSQLKTLCEIIIKVLVKYIAIYLVPDQKLSDGHSNGLCTSLVAPSRYLMLSTATFSRAARFCFSYLTFLSISQGCAISSARSPIATSVWVHFARPIFIGVDIITIQVNLFDPKLIATFE